MITIFEYFIYTVIGVLVFLLAAIFFYILFIDPWYDYAKQYINTPYKGKWKIKEIKMENGDIRYIVKTLIGHWAWIVPVYKYYTNYIPGNMSDSMVINGTNYRLFYSKDEINKFFIKEYTNNKNKINKQREEKKNKKIKDNFYLEQFR